jgi:hypothetical protein
MNNTNSDHTALGVPLSFVPVCGHKRCARFSRNCSFFEISFSTKPYYNKRYKSSMALSLKYNYFMLTIDYSIVFYLTKQLFMEN